MSQAHGHALWTEPASSGATPAVTTEVLTLVSGAWQHAPTVEQGSALDPGDGSRTIFDLASEYVAISDGAGGFVLSSAGTAAALLTDDGAGGLALTPVGAGVVKAGSFLPDSRGDVHAIRLDTADLLFVSLRNTIQSY